MYSIYWDSHVDKDGSHRQGNAYLNRLINSASTRTGLKCVITHDEDAVIKERMKRLVSKGFAIELLTLGSMIASIATDEGEGFKSGLPFAAIKNLFVLEIGTLPSSHPKKRERKAERGELRALSDLCTCRKTRREGDPRILMMAIDFSILTRQALTGSWSQG